MAITTIRTDDLDNTPDAVEVSFSLQGQDYKIDLGEKNLKKLEGVLIPFIDAAKKASAPRSTTKRAKVPAGEIRAWAKTQPEEISSLIKSDKGAVPKKAIEAYNTANGTSY